MTQNNLYMEDDNLRLYVDVQPTFIDELENSKNAAAVSATQAAQSAANAQGWLNDIISYKTNLELYYAQSVNNLSNWYNDTIAELANLKNTCLQTITTLSDSVLSSISSLYQQLINTMQTTGQSYLNQTREYAEQAKDAVDNRVSEEYLIQSNALESGNVSNISNVLANITKYAHSSFCGYQASNASPLDSKKFTVVGTPTITSDGIASGFSNSNYIYKNLNFTGSVIKIKGEFTWNGAVESSSGNICELREDNNNDFLKFYSDRDSGRVKVYTRVNNTGYYDFESYIIVANVPLYYQIIWTHSSITLLGYQNDIKVIDQTVTTHIPAINTSNTRVTFGGAGLSVVPGSIDLKQFSITVDGVPVFSGNKTGIDTIKADDYTVVGSPMISADGIASGFSTSNYLTINQGISGNNWIIKTKFYLPSGTNAQTVLQAYTTDNALARKHLQIQQWDTSIYVYIGDGTNQQYLSKSGLAANGWNWVNLIRENDKYYIEVSTDGINFSCSNGEDVTYNLNESLLCFGTSTNTYLRGSIDLNAFKIFVDGDLVYQPCLKIPYIQSSNKYGSKIVDSIYRDRVKDAFEQGFEQKYYTLDENNGNYTLPMGDLYGMIENLRKQIAQIAEQGE